MKQSIEQRFNRTLLAASIAAIGVASPAVTWADESANEIRRLTRPESVIELGVGNLSQGSFAFGDYTGLHKKGAHGIANVSVVRRGDADANYLEIVGRNLGLDSRSLDVEGGIQGNFGLSFSYSELPHLRNQDFKTPYDGAGTTRLTAPGGLTAWAATIDNVPGGGITNPVVGNVVLTTWMSQLGANMKPFEVRTDRKDLALGLTKMLPAGWDVELSYKNNKKDGTKLKGAPLQVAGGGSRGVALIPDPIDYTDNQFSLLARYMGEKLQVQLGYSASIFKNGVNSVVFDNLFYYAANAAGGNMLTGQLGSMPDNEFHQVSALAGYTLSKDTRLSGSVAIGRMTQNEAFLPYTSQTVVGLAALPTSSLNGKVFTKHIDFKLTTKLTKSVKLVAGYRYDDKDNKTPVNQFKYQTADNTALATYAGNATQSTWRMNTPLSKTKQVLFGDLDFHLSKATALKVGYDYDHIKHTYEPTAGDSEHTYKAELKHQFNETASGGIAYAYSDRKSKTYDGGLALQPTYTSVYLASLCVIPNTFVYNGVVTACTAAAAATGSTTPWLETPALRKSFLTDRKRDKLRAYANVAPSERLDLQFGGSYSSEIFPEAETGFGLTTARALSLNFDAALKATDKVTATFFLGYDNSSMEQRGHNTQTTNIARQNNTAAFWAARGANTSNQDISWTSGLGFTVKPGGAYEWGGKLSHASSKGGTSFHDQGTGLNILAMPDSSSRRTRLDLFSKYEMQKNLAVNLNYAYERFKSSDWAYDGQQLATSTQLIGTGMTSPQYSVHMIGVSASYKFQ